MRNEELLQLNDELNQKLELAFAVDAVVNNAANTTNISKGAAAVALLALNYFDAATCAKGMKCLQEAAVKGAKTNPKTTAAYVCFGAIVWCVSTTVTRGVIAANNG